MKENQLGKEKTIIVPAACNAVSVVHEWGDQVASTTGLTPGNSYSFTPDSIGVHKYIWKNGTAVVSTEFFQAFVPIITSSEFFGENNDLSAFEDSFATIEKLIRHKIQNYTGQRFGPYVNKSMEINGDGGDSIFLPVRITELISVLNDFGDDITPLCIVDPNESSFIQLAPRFSDSLFFETKRDIMWKSFELFNERTVFTITGNWGWEYVPTEVVEAVKLLIIQGLGGDEVLDMRNRGVTRTELGDFKLFINTDQWGSTGNAQSDNLLAPYVNIGIGLV